METSELVAGAVLATLAAVLTSGATLGNEDPASLADGVLVLTGWLVGLAISRYYPPE